MSTRRGVKRGRRCRQPVTLFSVAVVLVSLVPAPTHNAATQMAECASTITKEQEPNDSTITAQVVSIPVTIQGHVSSAEPGGDLRGADDIEDVYKFRVPVPQAGSAGTLLSITTTFDAGDIDIYLFRGREDGTGTAPELFDASPYVSNPEVIGPRCLPAGVYYLGVSEYDEPNTVRESNYTIRICVGGNFEVAVSDNGFASLTSRYVPPNAENLLLVNCLSPCRFPATVLSARLIFFRFRGLPDPTSQPITVVFFKGPAPGLGATPVPPTRPQITRVESDVVGIEAYFDVPLPETQRLVVNPGEVLYVGMEIRRPPPGVFPSIEFSPTSSNCSFLSADGGTAWNTVQTSSDDTRHFVFRANLQLR